MRFRSVWIGARRELAHAGIPGIATALSVLALAGALALGPLYLSSVRSAALRTGLEGACPLNLGVAFRAPIVGADAASELAAGERETAARIATVDSDLVGPPVRTIIGPIIRVSTAARSPGPALGVPVRLLQRDSADRSLTVLDDAGGDGVWVASSVSEAYGAIHAGDQIALSATAGRATSVRVRGIYQDLTRAPRSSAWCSLERIVYGTNDTTPPSPLLADRATATGLMRELGVDGQALWEYPVATRHLELSTATRLADKLRAAVADEPHARTFGRSADSTLIAFTRLAERTGAAVDPVVQMLSLAATLVCAVLLAASAWLWGRRNASHASILDARGVSRSVAVGRIALVALVPTAVGIAGALVLAPTLVRAAGPSHDVAALELLDPWRDVGLAAIIIVGVAGGAALGLRRPRDRTASPTTALALGGVMAGAFALVARSEIAGGTSTAPPRSGDVPVVDTFAVLFPILVFVSVALLGAAAFARAIRRARPSGWRRTAWALAGRRLAHGGVAVAASFGLALLSVAMAAYGLTLWRSTEATNLARARDSLGSDAVVRLPATSNVDLPARSTEVRRLAAVLRGDGGSLRVDVVAVDPSTIADAVHWRSEYGATDATSVAQALGGPTPSDGLLQLGVIHVDESVVGANPALVLSRGAHVDLATTIQARLSGYPSVAPSRATVLVDAATLPADALDLATREIWIRGSAPSSFLQADPNARTVTDVLDEPGSAVLRWSARFTLGMSIGFGALVLVAIALATPRRRRSLDVLLARMGVTPTMARRARAIEIGVPVLSGLVVGVVVAVWTVFDVADPVVGNVGRIGAVMSVPLTLLALLAVGVMIGVSFSARTRRTVSGLVGRDG